MTNQPTRIAAVFAAVLLTVVTFNTATTMPSAQLAVVDAPAIA